MLTDYTPGTAANTQVPRMYYTNFDEHITAHWRVICVAWPLPKFCSPADLKSRNEVQVLYSAWKSGITHFERLSVDAFENWEEARFQAALDQTLGTASGSQDGEDDTLYGADAEGYWAAGGDDFASAGASAHAVPDTGTRPFSLLTSFYSHALVSANVPSHNLLPPSVLISDPSPNSNTSACGSKRRANNAFEADEASTPVDSAPSTSITFLNGNPVISQKRVRKTRSDKGVPRGSRKTKN